MELWYERIIVRVIVPCLNLYDFPYENVCKGLDDIDNIVCKFKNHQSIIKLKERYKVKGNFSFRLAVKEETKAIIKYLPTYKAAGDEISVNIFKKSTFSFDKLTICVNHALISAQFPSILENANITPVHKKNDPTDKTNFGPVSALPLLSKASERIYNQLGKYIDTFLNKLLCEFRKAHSTQHVLFKLPPQQSQKVIDNSGIVGTILMDLSKRYNCLPLNHIIAKFEAYGHSKSSLSLHKQRVGLSYSLWNEIKRGFPQRSLF